MELQELKERLEQTGFPVAYYSFPENEAPPLPFICYLVTGSDNFAADGVVYAKALQIQIELYTREKDLQAEESVEAALSEFVWNKTESYIDSEKCYQIAYEIEV